jgi:hypothetical protein
MLSELNAWKSPLFWDVMCTDWYLVADVLGQSVPSSRVKEFKKNLSWDA